MDKSERQRIAEPIPQEWWEKRCAWYSGELDRLKASLAAAEAERNEVLGLAKAVMERGGFGPDSRAWAEFVISVFSGQRPPEGKEEERKIKEHPYGSWLV